MTVSTTGIEQQDLDPSDGREIASTSVRVSVVTPDGTDHQSVLLCLGDAPPAQLVPMLLACAEQAARSHSSEAGQLLAAHLRPML